MPKRLERRVPLLFALLGATWLVRRTLVLRQEALAPLPVGTVWPSLPEPDATPRVKPPKTWVEPTDGACPATHPVKAKLSSGLFHLPGMLAYARTHADRCYLSEAAAEADAFTKAKR